MNTCVICGRVLTQNEIGATKKLINRNSTEFLCVSCLADKFGVTEEKINEMIEKYRKSGCTLFV